MFKLMEIHETSLFKIYRYTYVLEDHAFQTSVGLIVSCEIFYPKFYIAGTNRKNKERNRFLRANYAQYLRIIMIKPL